MNGPEEDKLLEKILYHLLELQSPNLGELKFYIPQGIISLKLCLITELYQ